jgi:hypothetical protein
MRILFRRNTHDEHGNYRKECDFIDCPTAGIGVHAFDSRESIDFSAFVARNRKYYADNPMDGVLEVIPPKIADYLFDLAKMVRSGLVVAEVHVTFGEDQ